MATAPGTGINPAKGLDKEVFKILGSRIVETHGSCCAQFAVRIVASFAKEMAEQAAHGAAGCADEHEPGCGEGRFEEHL